MATYKLIYLGHVLDEDEFDTDDEARAWRDRFCQYVMAGAMPHYLTADDFDDLADCIKQHRVVRVVESGHP